MTEGELKRLGNKKNWNKFESKIARRECKKLMLKSAKRRRIKPMKMLVLQRS